MWNQFRFNYCYVSCALIHVSISFPFCKTFPFPFHLSKICPFPFQFQFQLTNITLLIINVPASRLDWERSGLLIKNAIKSSSDAIITFTTTRVRNGQDLSSNNNEEITYSCRYRAQLILAFANCLSLQCIEINLCNNASGQIEFCSPVKVGLDLEQIAIEGFLALTCLLGLSGDHIKSLQLLDTGKVVNLHKFKMADVQCLNLQITFFWLLLELINVLQTTVFLL